MSFIGRLRNAEPSEAALPAGRELVAEAPSVPYAVPSTWLAMPTLAESNTERRVVGTSFHQELLAATARELDRCTPRVG